jgi:cytochrome c biogenesis protein
MTEAALPTRRAAAWRQDVQELLSSMRFAISLLALICIAAMIGTVVRQREPFNNYVNEFGPFWAEVFRAAGLFTVYSSLWFLVILGFLVLSTSLCIARNAPRFIADFRTMKEDVRGASLKAFHHRGEGRVAGSLAVVEGAVVQAFTGDGWQVKVDRRETGTMVAARKGRWNRIGYILAHSSVVLICIAALLDGDRMVRIQMGLTGKTPYDGAGFIRDVPQTHRLSPANPSFRGNLLVPEGKRNDTAVLQMPDGIVLQPLPFDIELKRFVVEYYPTGMPRLFASDIVIHDHGTGATTTARVEVNKPVFHDGVAIYQSSFDDGGSRVSLKALPMRPGVEPFSVDGKVGDSLPLSDGKNRVTLEIQSLKVINVENLDTPAEAARAASAAASAGWRGQLADHLGSGAKGTGSKKLRNVGPAIVYRLRDASGQAREYHDYMQPVELDGQRVFLAGMRETPAEGFRYLRLPADENDKLDGWLRLRAALSDASMREQAATAYARAATPPGRPEMTEQLHVTSQRLLAIFAGAVPAGADGPAAADASRPAVGGLEGVSRFIEQSVPAEQREKVALLLVRILDGSLFDLNNLARAKAGLAPLVQTPETEAFMTQAVRSLSDASFYPAPFMLQLSGFDQVQASVFQVARAPGRKLVYLGAVLLIAGVFAMLYLRERRVWAWLAPPPAGSEDAHGAPATDVTLALSAARRTLDIDHEFERLKQHLLGTPAPAAGHRRPQQ